MAAAIMKKILCCALQHSSAGTINIPNNPAIKSLNRNVAEGITSDHKKKNQLTFAHLMFYHHFYEAESYLVESDVCSVFFSSFE